MPYRILLLLLISLGESTLLATPLSHEALERTALTANAITLSETKQCGSVYYHPGPLDADLIPADGFLSYGGPQMAKKKFTWSKFKRTERAESSYQTREAKVFLFNPDAQTWTPKELRHHLRRLLEERLRERATELFKTETQGLAGLDNADIDDLLGQIDDKLLNDDGKQIEKKIKILMTLYPSLRDTIVANEDDELRPLLCVFEKKQHNIKIGRRWSNLLVVGAVSLGVSGIIVGTQGIAVPALIITAGTVAVTVGARDIAWSIYQWNLKEKTSKIADRYRLALTEVKKTIAGLEKKATTTELSASEQELLTKLKDIDESFPKERRKKLTHIARGKHFNRMLLALGILNAGFNGVNFTGDATILASLPETILNLLGL